MSKPHDFDLITNWCKRCGIARQDAADAGSRDCIADSRNVVAISHIVRGGPLRALAAEILLRRRGFFNKPDKPA